MTNTLSYAIGTNAQVHDRACVITALIDVDQVLIQYKDDGEAEAVNIVNLKAAKDNAPAKSKALDAIPDDDLDIARSRFAAIEPLLANIRGKANVAREQAQKAGVSVRTLQRWLKAYTGRNLLSDLAPERRGKRKTRISKKVEAIIRNAIETLYLTKQKRTQKKVIDEISRQCRAARLKAPHPNTVRARIKAVDAKEKAKRRHGTKVAHDKYGEVKGEFPGATYPLAVVQIDHTLLDIMLVDDEHRKPMGRPWVTLAIDVYSRMVVGMYTSLDHPSAFSVGMCMQHAFLKKDAFLEGLGIKDDWNVWGIMRTIHADNGKDFRSQTIQKACDEYNISMEWRPVKKPYFGGHIERLMGTIAKEIHALPGSTFSNIRDKGDYNSDKTAVMTFTAFEQWLTRTITGVYHKRLHTNIGMAPVEKWREGIVGTGKIKGVGLPEPISDPERLRIDFLPYIERTVQRDGIVWDKVHYMSDSIRHWINAEQGRRKIKFIIRRDPRDISRIYFLDPELGEYLEIPYRDISKPTLSLWDFRAAEKHLRMIGVESVDEDAIFEAWDDLERIVEVETKTTRKLRRTQQRQKLHAPAQSKPETGIRVVVDNSTEIEDGDEIKLSAEDYEQNWEDWS